jgi:hypothetical protein
MNSGLGIVVIALPAVDGWSSECRSMKNKSNFSKFPRTPICFHEKS